MFSLQEKNRVRSWLNVRPVVKTWIICGLVVLFFLTASLFSVGYYFTWQAQQYDLDLVQGSTDQSSLYDENNQLIGHISANSHRLARYEDLPPQLIQALLAREDDSFFTHDGVDYMSFARSFLRNLKSMRYKQGGSTISMQLTRNVYELRAKSIERKLLEIALTMRIEQRYSKELILTQYFNRIYYGESCYGIADAALHYFSKDVKDLNLSECATLIGLVRGPSIFNPVVNMAKATQVRNETLERMFIHEFISEAQYRATLISPIELNINKSSTSATSYPLMLVPEVMKDFESYLSDDTSSIALVSSFNKDIQDMVEVLSEHCLSFIEGDVDYLPEWLEFTGSDESLYPAIEKRWKTKLARPKNLPTRQNDGLSKCLQCAVLVVDARMNRKGSLLAMTGGRDAIDGENRWLQDVVLGDAASPLLFCAALEPSAESVALVPNQLRQTGRRVGYYQVFNYFRDLRVLKQLPDAEHADKMYQGVFDCRLLDLAQLYYSILHQGVHYDFDFVRSIYSQNRQLLYAYRVPVREEGLRREATRVASTLSPFHDAEDQTITANVSLDEGSGQWAVISKNKQLSVFVWIGFDEAHRSMSHEFDVKSLSREFGLILARQIYQASLEMLEHQEEQREAESEAAEKKKNGKNRLS